MFNLQVKVVTSEIATCELSSTRAKSTHNIAQVTIPPQLYGSFWNFNFPLFLTFTCVPIHISANYFLYWHKLYLSNFFVNNFLTNNKLKSSKGYSEECP